MSEMDKHLKCSRSWWGVDRQVNLASQQREVRWKCCESETCCSCSPDVARSCVLQTIACPRTTIWRGRGDRRIYLQHQISGNVDYVLFSVSKVRFVTIWHSRMIRNSSFIFSVDKYEHPYILPLFLLSVQTITDLTYFLVYYLLNLLLDVIQYL